MSIYSGLSLHEASPAAGLHLPAAGAGPLPCPKSNVLSEFPDRFTRPDGVWVDPPASHKLTSFARLLPSFLILGAMRSGTTSLYRYLVSHPRVLPALRKEVHYFDFQYDKGRRWYLAHFPAAPTGLKCGRPLTGEASPYYLMHPLAPERVWAFNPAMKLIAILRDPVARALSHHSHEVRRGVEHLSFEAAVDVEAERLQGADRALRQAPHYYSYAHHHFSYLDRGRYAHYLQAWLDFFPRRRLLVLRSEDMFRDADRIANEVFKFLELPPHRLRDEAAATATISRPPLEPALRDRLHGFFAADQERLRELWNSTA